MSIKYFFIIIEQLSQNSGTTERYWKYFWILQV